MNNLLVACSIYLILGIYLIYAALLRCDVWLDMMDDGSRITTPSQLAPPSVKQAPTVPSYLGKQCYLTSVQQANFLSNIEKHPHILQEESRQSPVTFFRKECPIWTRGVHNGTYLGNGLWLNGGANCLLGQKHVFVGDSMMRQIFSSIIHGLRSQGHGVDYSSHVHARYATSAEEDIFDPVIDSFEQLFQSSWPQSFENNNSAQMIFTAYYLHFPKPKDWIRSLGEVISRAGSIDVMTILPVCFWDMTELALEEGSFKETIAKHLCGSEPEYGCVRKFSVVSCPTSRIPDSHDMRAVIKRNQNLEKWTNQLSESAPGRVQFIDFDMIVASTPGGAVGDLAGNWHYECYMTPVLEQVRHNKRSPISLYPKEDGTCSLLDGNPNAKLVSELVSHACTANK